MSFFRTLILLFFLLPLALSAQTRENDEGTAAGATDAGPVPAFIFRSLDDSSYISHADLMGKVYLVDFWATWCPPCVEALPELENIHEEFHSRGFEIVSLSFDNSDERIRVFRSKHFRMPWLHGRVDGGFSDILSITFHLENIPHYVLVSRDGRILAQGDDLHGARLHALIVAALEE